MDNKHKAELRKISRRLLEICKETKNDTIALSAYNGSNFTALTAYKLLAASDSVRDFDEHVTLEVG
jgi:hypothetical protein